MSAGSVRGLWRVVLAGAAALVLAGVAIVVLAGRGSSARPSTPPARRGLTCRSPALGGTLPALVYLPTGYGNGNRRYPVIYFLHGLPAGPGSYVENDFVADAVESGSQRAIVVAPQGARTQNSDREYLNWSSRENWPQAIAGDLTRCVDLHYRTIANRSGRALIGLSAGGFGAFNIGLRRPATFGAIESWGGYFEATDPSGLHRLDLESSLGNQMAQAPRGSGLEATLASLPTFIGFYVGRQDSRFLQDNIEFDHALSSAGIEHVFRTYPGGHSGALWQAHAQAWIGYALAALSAHR